MLAIIIIVTFLLLLFDAPQIYDKTVDFVNSKTGTELSHISSVPFRLGLDLQGGTHLVYEADTSKIESGQKGESVEGVRDVIERRVNAFGVSEPVVQVNKSNDKWRVIVELAGISDVREAIKMIGETPLLEFKTQNEEPPRELTAEEQKQLDEQNAEAEKKADELLKEVQGGADFDELIKTYSSEDRGRDNGVHLGWIHERGPYRVLAETAAETEVGQIHNKVVEQASGFYIVQNKDQRNQEKEVKASHILICFQGTERCERDTTKEDAEKLINELKEQATPKNFAKLAEDNSTGPSASTGGDLGFFTKGQMVPEFDEVVMTMEVGTVSEVVETQFGYHLIYKTDEQELKEYKVSYLMIGKLLETDILPPQDQWLPSELTGKQLDSARVEFDQTTNIPQVSLVFNDEGKDLFAELTTDNVGKPIAIFLDGSPISVPRVNEPIKGGEAVITGDFDIQESQLLAQRLNAGALPVPIELVSQQTVGASLGNESLQKSLFAGMIGLILVALFMIGYYRLPGLLSVLALCIYGVVVLFVFKAIPVTLTLAGIAGFILSIGMAVDANVLIFERLKEELRMGKPVGTAIEEGFKRAWTSIRDGNVSTLITCFILAWFGTSMIKGFAITLGIGVLLSMFSAIVVTRQLLMVTVNPKKSEKRLWLFGVNKKDTK